MATLGRMPSRTREEELRQEGSGLPVWRTRLEQCACEEVLLCCKGFLGLGYKKELRVRSSHRVHDVLWCLSSLAPAVEKKKKKKRCFEAGSTSEDPPDGDCGKDAEQDERGRTPSGWVRASCMEDPSGTMRLRGGPTVVFVFTLACGGKKKKRCFEAGSTSADPPDGDCGKDAEQDERGRTPSGGVRASCLEDPSGTMRLRGGISLLQRVFGPRIQKGTPC
ncbi:uncharacterized protein LOC133497134 [Syngnathoides biaculeatus]|uniref:uncharacterized protein LOC133497134 n=1 Tax=Syngnathoides biaculeatus TaxID=300417 RepID=UPI002ADDF63D|nr:uncharacterized protein LOC133497134 [Syngnathoides biaculeatus]